MSFLKVLKLLKISFLVTVIKIRSGSNYNIYGPLTIFVHSINYLIIDFHHNLIHGI